MINKADILEAREKRNKEDGRPYVSILRYDSKWAGMNYKDSGANHFVIQEKFDGSNFSVRKINGELIIYGRKDPIDFTLGKSFNMLKGFIAELEDTLNNALNEGDYIVGEYIRMGKTGYNKTHKGVIFYDTYRALTDTWVLSPMSSFGEDFDNRRDIALISFDNTSVRVEGLLETINSGRVLSSIDNVSKIEGVVIKEVTPQGVIVNKVKMVADSFSEIAVKTKKDKSDYTPARVEKFFTKLIEADLLERDDIGEMKTISKVLKQSTNLFDDLWKEESEMLIENLKKQLKRDAISAIKRDYLKAGQDNV